jgi:type VI secretion system protein ImpA
MPLRDDLLNPIPGPNPSGENLKYNPVYDKIKEARRQEDDAPQGDWQRERKVADFILVIKLAGDSLATKSKDLQLAAWLTEALLNREGFSGLCDGLKLIRGLIENFWDTLYPEIEDGDTELRATPVEWVGSRLDKVVKETPLTRGGYGYFKYQESRAVGYEEQASESQTRMEARATAIAEGKLVPEEFDKDFTATPREFYVKVVADLEANLEQLEELAPICEEKFGEFNPSFSKLRSALEEVRHTAKGLLQKKQDPTPAAAPTPEVAEPEPEATEYVSESPAAVAPASRPAARRITSAEPVDKEDAVARIVAVAAYLRREDPYSPASFLLLRGLRWGELRAAGAALDASVLDSPPTDVRQTLKRLANEGSWTELLEAAEGAMGSPCGRGWLDLQRHVVRACEELGSYYDSIAVAVKSELRALLNDYPDLPLATMNDDTPVANGETQVWLKTIHEPAPAAAPVYTPPAITAYERQESEELGTAEIDPFTLAMSAAKAGRVQEAIEILSTEISHQNSGRGKFQRKMQLSQLCMSIGHEAISKSILEELARTIDRHQLEDWESPDVVAHALSMLYECMQKLNGDPVEKQKLYARICRLDPMQALAHTR